jgi:hypothetical protein
MLTDVSEEITASIFMVEESDFLLCFILLFLFNLLFNPEDKDDMSLRNIGRFSTEYMAYVSQKTERGDGCLTEVFSRL